MLVMSNKRIYLDQNIIGDIRDGIIDISAVIGVDWIYSEEHFEEIKRGNEKNRHAFLGILKQIKAVYLEFNRGENYCITGEPIFNEQSFPDELFDSYMEDYIEFDMTLLSVPIVYLFGANNLEELRGLPAKAEADIKNMFLSQGVSDEDMSIKVGEAMKEMVEAIELNLPEVKSLEKGLRKILGTDKGRASQVEGPDKIRKLWDVVEKNFDEISCEQFFGFKIEDAQEYETEKMHNDITACHGMLNMVGYCSDAGISKSSKFANISSDAGHIFYAAFCDIFISADQRLRDKAEAIYEYKEIKTRVMPWVVQD